MITVSEKARAVLKRYGAGQDRVLRIRVKTGGCAGMTYDAELVKAAAEDEKVVYRDKDLAVVADKGSRDFLEGLRIDYSDDLISAGFRFSNSSNESSCGCGASFSLAGFPAPIKRGVNCGV